MSKNLRFVLSFLLLVISFLVTLGGAVSVLFTHDLLVATYIVALGSSLVCGSTLAVLVLYLEHIIDQLGLMSIWKVLMPKKFHKTEEN